MLRTTQTKVLLISLFFFFTCPFTKAQVTVNTLSEMNGLLDDIEFRILLNTDVKDASRLNLSEYRYFIPLINFLDLNVFGKGSTLHLDPDRMVTYISSLIPKAESGKDLSAQVLNGYKNGSYDTEVLDEQATTERKKAKVGIGGFFTVEYEYHQEPDGEFHPMLEINQTRIFFNADLNPTTQKNHITFLGEWNPVPEESIHQIDFIQIPHDTSIYTLEAPGADEDMSLNEMYNGETIPFERLHLSIEHVAGSFINLKVGQFRNPFGIWSDYTSHRNFSSTKNNQLVNGYALKKIDLGLMAALHSKNGFELEIALMNGRLSRTTQLSRDDIDDFKDLSCHTVYSMNHVSLGASVYLAECKSNRLAAGIDYLVNFKKISISGEVVYQKNSEPEKIFSELKGSPINELSSVASYLQFDLELKSRWHLYGFYEMWQYEANAKVINRPEYKVFHGIRYYISPSLRWMVLEYGHMFHKGFDKGSNHFSSQLELTF